MLLALVCAAVSTWWGFDLAQTYGTSPGDGGVTAPLAARLAWGVGVGALGVLFAVGMWLYGRCYVTKMELDQRAGKLYVHTVRFFGTRRHAFDVSGVLGSVYHEGELDSDLAPSVDAPWTSVSLAGRRLPLIVDQQGEFLQQELMDELFRSASPPASS
jgi:transmembrane protein TMEM70 (proton-transport ATP synthase complex)